MIAICYSQDTADAVTNLLAAIEPDFTIKLPASVAVRAQRKNVMLLDGIFMVK